MERGLVPVIADLIKSAGRDKIVVAATHDPLLAEGLGEQVRLRAGVIEAA